MNFREWLNESSGVYDLKVNKKSGVDVSAIGGIQNVLTRLKLNTNSTQDNKTNARYFYIGVNKETIDRVIKNIKEEFKSQKKKWPSLKDSYNGVSLIALERKGDK